MIIDTFNSGLGPWLIPGINERLRELHARDGSAALSMSMIAAKLNEEFGLHLTRNSIVGRCHRLRLPARPTPIIPRKKPGPKPMRIVKVDTPIIPEIAVAPPSEARVAGLTIYQTGYDDCKWPVSDDNRGITEFYCGAPAIEGRPYCGAHCRRAYNTPRMSWT
jgi:GcrA cell cycle regulator